MLIQGEEVIIQNCYVYEDDYTYVYGGAHKFVNKDGIQVGPILFTKLSEPSLEYDFVYFYENRYLFICYKNNKIVEIVYTMSCWSDNYVLYYIEDDKVSRMFETIKGSYLDIIYKDGVIVELKGHPRYYPEIGSRAPRLESLLKGIDIPSIPEITSN